MIRSCGTKDWSNVCWKFSIAVVWINDILQYIYTEYCNNILYTIIIRFVWIIWIVFSAGVFIISNLPHIILTLIFLFMYLFIFFTELFYQALWENKWKTKPWIPDVGCIYITNHMRHFRQLTCTGTKFTSYTFPFLNNY